MGYFATCSDVDAIDRFLVSQQRRYGEPGTFGTRLQSPDFAMVARGYGETMPISDNQTEAGRALNRRIEFRPADAPHISEPMP